MPQHPPPLALHPPPWPPTHPPCPPPSPLAPHPPPLPPTPTPCSRVALRAGGVPVHSVVESTHLPRLHCTRTGGWVGGWEGWVGRRGGSEGWVGWEGGVGGWVGGVGGWEGWAGTCTCVCGRRLPLPALPAAAPPSLPSLHPLHPPERPACAPRHWHARAAEPNAAASEQGRMQQLASKGGCSS